MRGALRPSLARSTHLRDRQRRVGGADFSVLELECIGQVLDEPVSIGEKPADFILPPFWVTDEGVSDATLCIMIRTHHFFAGQVFQELSAPVLMVGADARETRILND